MWDLWRGSWKRRKNKKVKEEEEEDKCRDDKEELEKSLGICIQDYFLAYDLY